MKFEAESCWTDELEKACSGEGDKKLAIMASFEWAARVFQKQYDEMLDQAPMVYWRGEANLHPWWRQEERQPRDTHQARLVCIEPIGKESGE